MSARARKSAHKPATRKTVRRKSSSRSTNRWSGRVTRESHALDLEEGVFKKRDPKDIAKSLKRSADLSHARKAEPYRSALSMLVFYINRAGKNLPAGRKKRLERAKGELKKLYHRD
jgi:hypothetical protein